MKKTLHRQAVKAVFLFVALVQLSGCTASIPLSSGPDVTLPPPAEQLEAPQGDAGSSFAETVLLSLPSTQSGQLQMYPERILLSHTRHPADFALRKLFSYLGTTQANPLSETIPLSLIPGSSVEISGDTATVNLSAGALALDNKVRYLVSRSITNTLTQWGDIRFVNVLINGRQQGIDTAATIPLGSLTKTENDDINALWEAVNRQPAANGGNFSSTVTLYFPATAGRGILAEARLVNLQSGSFPEMVKAILQALSMGSSSVPNIPQMPDLVTLLSQDPVIEERADASGRVVNLRFYESANEALIAAGIPRSVLMASLTYTLTTFLPYTAGVRVTIGDEEILAIVPAGLFEGAGQEILFNQGIMQRSQFSRFLLDHCSLYFANSAGTLSLTRRPIPFYEAYNPRFLMNQLITGPLNTDSASGLYPVLPSSLRDADLLGITRQGDIVLVNFSDSLLTQTAAFDEKEELLMVYAMVNTLTAQRGMNKVSFFIEGEQAGTFSGHIDVAGIFLRNEGIIR
jgi:spore germination protein GerM